MVSSDEIPRALVPVHSCSCLLTALAAFILYRISHHSKVAQENPGLSNPDISKIIGDKWKKEPDEEKDTWRKLADEEKRRHQQMYPDYRYQPRRASKGQSIRKGGNSPIEEAGRCPKCQGRLLSTPDTLHGGPVTPKTDVPDPLWRQGGRIMESPAVDRRRHSFQLTPSRTQEMRDEESPNAKRRRLNEIGDPQPLQPPIAGAGVYTPRQTFEHPGSVPTSGQNTPTRLPFSGGPLPQPGGIPRSQSGPIAPGPRGFATQSWTSPGTSLHTQRNDSAYKLPPLHTTTPPTQSVPTGLGLRPAFPRSGSDTMPQLPSGERRSFSAEVMRMPVERKLSFLAKLWRVLPKESQKNSGRIIAVEGSTEPRTLSLVGDAVEQALWQCKNVLLRNWRGDLRSTGALTEERNPTKVMSFPEYMQRIVRWHDKSSQIISHVTSEHRNEGLLRSDHSSEREVPAATSQGRPTGQPLIPVALIRDGYCLTESDRFACNSSVAEHWPPQDHWQWAAMLWRGMAMPDLTVLVSATPEEEIDQLGSVEFQRKLKLLLVRVPPNSEPNEATKRRLEFEIQEWMTDRGLNRSGE